jgi:hypothetical protein
VVWCEVERESYNSFFLGGGGGGSREMMGGDNVKCYSEPNKDISAHTRRCIYIR